MRGKCECALMNFPVHLESGIQKKNSKMCQTFWQQNGTKKRHLWFETHIVQRNRQGSIGQGRNLHRDQRHTTRFGAWQHGTGHIDALIWLMRNRFLIQQLNTNAIIRLVIYYVYTVIYHQSPHWVGPPTWWFCHQCWNLCGMISRNSTVFQCYLWNCLS